MSPNVSVIIPTFNRKEVTKRCVQSLVQGSYSQIKIIICDSDSNDGTESIFAEDGIHQTINVGSDSWWSAAVNRGVSVAIKDGCDFILIINDDISFSPCLVGQLVSKINGGKLEIVSPAQKTFGGLFLGTEYKGLLKYRRHIWSSANQEEIEVATSNGCCLLIPAQIFKNIGLFDEARCPHLAGDIEFQLRASHRGYKTKVFPDLVIEQQGVTDYYKKMKLHSVFTYKGSPLLVSAYIAFGEQLFGSKLRFILLGVFYHLSYMRSLLKVVYLSLRYGRL